MSRTRAKLEKIVLSRFAIIIVAVLSGLLGIVIGIFLMKDFGSVKTPESCVTFTKESDQYVLLAGDGYRLAIKGLDQIRQFDTTGLDGTMGELDRVNDGLKSKKSDYDLSKASCLKGE